MAGAPALRGPPTSKTPMNCTSNVARASRSRSEHSGIADTVESMAEPIICGGPHGIRSGKPDLVKATGADTAQAFSFIERVLPPLGRRPTPHRHTNCHEAFYVLEGTIEFEIERRTTSGAAGTFILVPPGGLHTFANRSDLDARLLILHSPAMDRYFVELHGLLLNGGDLDAEQSLMERFGMELDKSTP